MKAPSLLLLIAFVMIAAGCADPLEQRSTEEVSAQLERGVTGQGQLGPINRPPNDQANEHSVPETHP
jgi:hypothetical protein